MTDIGPWKAKASEGTEENKNLDLSDRRLFPKHQAPPKGAGRDSRFIVPSVARTEVLEIAKVVVRDEGTKLFSRGPVRVGRAGQGWARPGQAGPGWAGPGRERGDGPAGPSQAWPSWAGQIAGTGADPGSNLSMGFSLGSTGAAWPSGLLHCWCLTNGFPMVFQWFSPVVYSRAYAVWRTFAILI